MKRFSAEAEAQSFTVHNKHDEESETPYVVSHNTPIAQGKSDADIGAILGCAENTMKVHIARIFEMLGFENRNSATVRALEVLNAPGATRRE